MMFKTVTLTKTLEACSFSLWKTSWRELKEFPWIEVFEIKTSMHSRTVHRGKPCLGNISGNTAIIRDRWGKKILRKYLNTFYSLTGKLQMITVPQRNVFGNLCYSDVVKRASNTQLDCLVTSPNLINLQGSPTYIQSSTITHTNRPWKAVIQYILHKQGFRWESNFADVQSSVTWSWLTSSGSCTFDVKLRSVCSSKAYRIVYLRHHNLQHLLQ